MEGWTAEDKIRRPDIRAELQKLYGLGYQRKFARALRMSHQQIWYWLNQGTVPSATAMRRINQVAPSVAALFTPGRVPLVRREPPPQIQPLG